MREIEHAGLFEGRVTALGSGFERRLPIDDSGIAREPLRSAGIADEPRDARGKRRHGAKRQSCDGRRLGNPRRRTFRGSVHPWHFGDRITHAASVQECGQRRPG
jgi:hypothetical protein